MNSNIKLAVYRTLLFIVQLLCSIAVVLYIKVRVVLRVLLSLLGRIALCRVKLASTTPTPREEIACVGCKIVAVFGESVSVSVSASWNASMSGPATLKG